MEFIVDLITTCTYIVTIASIIAAYTPSEKDDRWISKLYGYLDIIALNFKIRR
jgi:hypothetical protein